jgi:hypothetical protein
MYAFSPHSPTPEEFAELVAESLVNRGSAKSQLIFDRSGFALLIKDTLGRANKEIFLSNLYREYCEGDVITREKVLLSAASAGTSAAVDSEELKARLLPQVKARWTVERMRLQNEGKRSGGRGERWVVPHGVIAEHFAVLLTTDAGDSGNYLTSIQLLRSQITFQQAVDRAVDNLAERTSSQFESLVHADTDEVILHTTTWKDGLDAARILFASNIEALPVRGEHLIFLINPNYMLVTGTLSERGLMYAYSELRQANKERPGFPPFAVLLRDGVYSRYRVPATSLWHHFFHEMELRYFSGVCKEQKDFLQSESTFLLPGCKLLDYELAKNDQGRMFSYCVVYDRSLPALLPPSDYIYLQNKNGRAASGSFERVRRIFPQLFESTGFYPTRYLLTRFPSAQQLAEIGLGESFE